MEQPFKFKARVICDDECGPVELTWEEWDHQNSFADARWRCPKCQDSAYFDDDYFEIEMEPRKPIPPLSLVVFDLTTVTPFVYEKHFKSTFPQEKSFVFVGEIPNAPDHCILVDLDSGKVLGMYHTSNFKVLSD